MLLTAVLDGGDGGCRREEEEDAGGGEEGEGGEALLGRHGRRVGLGELEDWFVRGEIFRGWIYKRIKRVRVSSSSSRVFLLDTQIRRWLTTLTCGAGEPTVLVNSQKDCGIVDL
jgi:hypothetical protein